VTGDARDTIFALSSGSLPAAVGVIRVSGPRAAAALEAIAGKVPEPRRAVLSLLRKPSSGEVIDGALILFFPGPRSETGEDLAEFQIHGGRAIAVALLAELAALPGLRPAEPGEFTRRAFENGKIDLTTVEGLSDLVFAETEAQRRAAVGIAGGLLRRRIEAWQDRLLELAAQVEAALDFSDEGDVGEERPAGWNDRLVALLADMSDMLARPMSERLRDGIKVVIAGPPNAGKSTLLNALSGRDAAITSEIPGTTRDVLEAPTGIAGIPFVLTDTAGLRSSTDAIEAIGVERAHGRLAEADIILWLDAPDRCPDRSRAIILESKADIRDRRAQDVDLNLSPVTGEGMDRLIELLLERARALLPREGEMALNARQREMVAACRDSLIEARDTSDLLLVGEALRQARVALDRVTGRAGVEDMLDALFGRFCVGK